MKDVGYDTGKGKVDKKLILKSLIRNGYSFDAVWKAGYYGILHSFGKYDTEDLVKFVYCFDQVKSNNTIKAYMNNKYHTSKNNPKQKQDYMGIYQITNKKTRECYIGSSSNIHSRIKGHRRLLKRGRHACYLLQVSWNKHGEGAFDFCGREKVIDRDILLAKEREWME